MRRCQFLILVIFAILAGEGCRRGGGGKRAPLKVGREADFYLNEAEDMINKAAPKKVINVEPNDPRIQGGKFPDAWFESNHDVKFPEPKEEADKPGIEKLKMKFEADKEDWDRAKRVEVMKKLGELFLSFCESHDAPKRSTDNLLTFVRRQKEYTLYRALKKGDEIQVIMEADPGKQGQLIGHYTSGIKEEYAYVAVAKGAAKADVTKKKEQLDSAALLQRLLAVHKAYKGYCQEASERDYDKFKEYFKKNGVPNAYELHTKKEIMVLDPAKLPPANKALKAVVILSNRQDEKSKMFIGATYAGTPGTAPEIPPTFRPDK